MSWRVLFKPLARAEIEEAYAWYDASAPAVAKDFLAEVGRVEQVLTFNPLLYPRVDAEIRRAVLSRFPYSLYYLVEADAVLVLSCFHHHRDPQTRVRR
jgi:plasmid stabilization system protein ParE